MDSVSDNRNNVSQVLITALGSRWQTMQSLLGEATTVLMGFNDFFQISSQALYRTIETLFCSVVSLQNPLYNRKFCQI